MAKRGVRQRQQRSRSHWLRERLHRWWWWGRRGRWHREIGPRRRLL